ncbi:hypothetical protein DN409_30425 (plasmid) [Bacillus mycoides]|nr:hypothetical protein DN409_30425 [Bacillus mycoides]
MQFDRPFSYTSKCLHQNQNDSKLYSKYEWIAQYHNYFFDEYVIPEGIEKYDLKIQGIAARDFLRIV